MIKDYCINDSLRIFDNGENEIRFKLGLFNYNEAALNLKNESEEFKEAFRSVLNDLKKGNSVAVSDIENLDISDETKNNIMNILNGLTQAGMLKDKEAREVSNQISNALLGDYKYYVREDKKQKTDRKILFLTDNSFSEKMAKLLIDEMELKVTVADSTILDMFRDADLTSNMDALKTITQKENIKNLIKKYDGVCVCFKRPEIATLRNINRVSIDSETPVICSFIDGPFITAFSTNYPKTGCVECFEQRTLSRIEDSVSYNNFQNFKFENSTKDLNKGNIPLLNMLTNLVISEAFLLSHFGTTKLENRVLNIYVPTLEIQVQDLLRVPYCPACGNVSKANFRELNVSTRAIVDNIIDSIE